MLSRLTIPFAKRLPMRNSKTLAKIRNGEVVRMCCLGHFIPSFICHAAHFSFDCIWLDCEHRTWTARELQSVLAYFHKFDIDCMLRAPTTDKTRLYRYLEDGATGLMIPHVSTPEKAAQLADDVKFPPVGNRGLDAAGLDSDFYLHTKEHGLDSYVRNINEQTFLVVQIETPQAVENVDAIAATPGVDGLFIGPGDLGLRLTHHEGDMTIESATEAVAAAAKKHGKAWGRPAGTLEQMQELQSQGAQLIAHGGDFMALMKELESSSADFDQLT